MPSPDRPVSDFLEADLAKQIGEKGVVVWLDLDDTYGGFVERLIARRAAGELGYPVERFRGSFLELMLKLGGSVAGVDATPLLIHLPGFNEQRVHASPLLELYEIGKRYRKALDTLVVEAAVGRVSPANLEQARTLDSKTLDAADVWLARVLARDAGTVSAELRVAQPEVLVEDLLLNGPVSAQAWNVGAGPGNDAKDNARADRLRTTLQAWLGITDAWRELVLPAGVRDAEDLAFLAASWAMSVEYTHDLTREPKSPKLSEMRTLPKPLVAACKAVCERLRERHSDYYAARANETEGLLSDEVGVARAEDLGKIDTFRFEEEVVLRAAITALEEARYKNSAGWAKARLEKASVWLARDPLRKSAWDLVAQMARLGLAIDAAGPRLGATDLAEAVRHYQDAGAEVDRAHRHLEQKRRILFYPGLPEYGSLRGCLDAARRGWRGWADTWAEDFNALCTAQGFRPSPELQQRTLFDQIVTPMAQGRDPVAYFMVDAMRFELGEELRRAIVEAGGPATQIRVRLEARLAELPTVTEVGMNALAPVSREGRLTMVLSTNNNKRRIEGIQAGEYRVNSPATRKRAIHDRVGGTNCPMLSVKEVKASDSTLLKQRIAKAQVIIVHSREVDEAGEVGSGPSVFDSVVQDLRAAYHLLREAGVRRFVFTADHGFLLLDDSAGSVQLHGRKVDPRSRYALSALGADGKGEARVAMKQLHYDLSPAEDIHIIFPASTAVFDTGARPGFVHGGNSLQERVIPVLIVEHQSPAGASALRYATTAQSLDPVGDLQCLKVVVEPSGQQGLAYGGAADIELALRVHPASLGNPEAAAEMEIALVQVRGGDARLNQGAFRAMVNKPVEVFFRVLARGALAPERVQVEVYHPSAEERVQPGVPTGWFVVTPPPRVSRPPLATLPNDSPAEPRDTSSITEAWLSDLPEGGVRAVFKQLLEHGTVTEEEATKMLGGARQFRQFSGKLESYSKNTPFSVGIDINNGTKCYVRKDRK